MERSFTLFTFVYRCFNPDMIYVDMKVSLETIYDMFSQSHSFNIFPDFVLDQLYVFPTNEPPWKWRGKSQSHPTGGKRRKLKRIIVQCKCVLILHIIRDFQVGKFRHQFLFKSNGCFTDRRTKVIGVIRSFKIFLESLDLFDVFVSTFYEIFLQKRKNIC